jgi:hypothetical protein
MKLSEFILLNVEEKKSTVLHQGILIAKRSQVDYLVFLFQLDNYYVEAFCHEGNKAIDEFRVSDNTEFLSPYLDSIRIDDLLN